MSFLQQQHITVHSGLFVKKRILTIDHVFFTNSPGSDMNEYISLDKNSFMLIHRFICKFSYAQAPAAGYEYYTNHLNFSGKFLFNIENYDSGTVLQSFKIPICQHFDIKFDSMIIDEDSVKNVSFTADNSNLEAYKEGVANITSTIEKIGLYFYLEIMDYPKEFFKVVGKNLEYKK